MARYWFNYTLDVINQFKVYNFYKLRRIIQDWRLHSDWAFQCPQRIREHAIHDAQRAVSNAIKKFKTKTQFQRVKFRTKRGNQSFGFDKQSINKNSIFRGKNRIDFTATEEINPDQEGTRLILQNGRYFVIAPIQRAILKPENQRFRVVALDPGVRTFITYYSPQLHGKLGQGDFNHIYRLCLGLDKLISKTKRATARRRYKLKKAQQRLRWKIKDMINELHHKTARFLCDHFDIILVPTFETQNMVSKLHHKTSRNMLNFAHFRFKQFLKYKAEELSCIVLDVNEAYTSKTCSYCGKIQKIGSKSIFKCKCGALVDRDYNGARNILLRALRASSPISSGNC